MRKFTLFFVSLFLAVGAMAQTELDGCYVAFANVQQNGTEYSLYVNANNELAVSTTPVSELGESAKFKCELKDNGKYTFYNESAGVYMIWRGKGSGYNSDKGVLAEYNATYCDWTLVMSANKPGCYYFYSKRNGDSSDGSLVIMNAPMLGSGDIAAGYSCDLRYQLKQLSSNIISIKPIAKPIVPMLLCLPFCDDGISSSTTT